MLASPPPLQDPASFSELYSRTQIIVYRFIYGLHGGPREDVEDLTCDTYLRAWNGRNRFNGDDHAALCWLFTIARNLVIDAHRRKKTNIDSSTDMIDDSDLDTVLTSSQHSPEEQTARKEQFLHLWMLMQSLSCDRREMLVLRYLLGWQVKQIAKYLQIEENTVSVNIRRSLEALRTSWSESEA